MPAKRLFRFTIQHLKATWEKPYQELAAFGKTKLLAPGESQVMTISFKTASMASYCEKCASWVLEAGKYYIRVGNSSRNTTDCCCCVH